MRRICFHLNSLERGGAERVVSTLAGLFAAHGYEVSITTEWYADEEYELDPRIHRVHVGLREEDEKKGRWTKFRLRVRYLREFLEKEQPDICVAFTHRPNYRALMAAKGTGIPVVIAIRDDPTALYSGWDDRIQIPLLFPRAAGCVFQTRQQKAFFAPKYFEHNSRIILNPLNPKYLQVTPAEDGERKKEVVMSSRLVRKKNQAMLLRAFEKVYERHPDYCLKIYGKDDGDGTKEELEKIIADFHAQDYMLLLGASDHLERDLRDAMVYCLSSDYEGMPNALLEAMAMGLPCVSTDCPAGAPGELIRDGESGLLVPVGDADAMAAAICRMIEDADLRQRCGQGALSIREAAAPEKIYEQWRDFLALCEQNAGKKA
ncbi:MAG: glycosyltransferase family 4 protein [Lachnospiraceae bacterium]|jgi:glycosyltransferase involved in cell wall biosynthesis|nr:glycosyltransferase family 4 protein [Lachnospiraceae bacterium]MCI1397773.1 glycosyltransferase family 4 protein [Lachnospiraceae bacterium]MCI1422876.1 glycosyltransferase family 4 protein [Lachnospiraceae bacterium]MCI1451605.1 glycosyltransferase family 4 protein [Lachnospiraceae bacterium]